MDQMAKSFKMAVKMAVKVAVKVAVKNRILMIDRNELDLS